MRKRGVFATCCCTSRLGSFLRSLHVWDSCMRGAVSSARLRIRATGRIPAHAFIRLAASYRRGPITTRQTIVDALRAELEPPSFIDAFWEGGAGANDRVDEWSDMDLYVHTDAARIDDTERAVERALSRLSKIDAKYVIARPASEKIRQVFYRLEGTSPFLLIDLSIVEPTTPDKCLEPEAHGRKRVYFDKTGATITPVLDHAEPQQATEERLGQLRKRIEMCHVFVDKDLNRGRSLEALDSYHVFVLQPLIDALRITYTPVHYEFGMKYIHRELPADVVHRLERLAFVRDAEDLRAKTAEALAWFRNVAAQR